MKIILASASPRRKALLTVAGVEFEIIPSLREETADKALPPAAYATALATFKAEDVASMHGGVVLGADTIVVFDGKVLGKPKDRADAVKTLRMLSGNKHQVITGYCVFYGANCQKNKRGCVVSDVYFNDLSDEFIEEYVNTGSCMDKAGSYGVQDGYDIVKRVEGSLSNVIGLPVNEVLAILKEIENEEY